MLIQAMEGVEGADFEFDDLDDLNMGLLRSTSLEGNPLFSNLIGRLVNFYKKLNEMKHDPEIQID